MCAKLQMRPLRPFLDERRSFAARKSLLNQTIQDKITTNPSDLPGCPSSIILTCYFAIHQSTTLFAILS